ncbi:MAG: FAD-binding protein [Coriobacteriales bacterium]|jgi:succinate dehydrogenase/fumarate reductase flavoprotein subunit|nr:FAD-binding protein [Coriobacteriales bacterium]
MSKDKALKNNLSRRDFLKGAGLTVGAVSAVGAGAVLQACTDSPGTEGKDYIFDPVGSPYAVPTKWDQETDVIVIGTGDGGAPAAIRAFDGGADVIIIDKGDFFGGCSVLGGGATQLAVTHVQKAQGIDDKPEWAYEDTMVHGLYRSIPEVLQAWIDNSEPFSKWAEDVCDFEWGTMQTQEPARVPRTHRAKPPKDIWNEGQGVNMSYRYHQQIEKRNIPILLEHRMTKIYRKGTGPVVGIEVETKSGKKNIKARKAVIVATGGFKGNPQMIRAYHAAFDETLIWSGWPDVKPTGDGHLAIEAIGGGCIDMSFIMEFSGRLGSKQYVRGERPHFDHPSTPTGIPYSKLEQVIFVNNSGKRYLNEDEWEAGHTLAWTDWMVAFLLIEGRPRMEWFVADKNGAIDVGWDKFDAAILSPNKDVTPCLEPGWVAKADTIAELASKMGVPSAALQETITKYNGMCDSGKDTDFGSKNLFKIVEPPFYAARWCRMTHDQSTGIRVNAKMQIVEQSNQWIPGEVGASQNIMEEKVIPHLYAVGECTGGTGGAIRGSGKRGYYQVQGYIGGGNAANETAIA